MVRVRGDERRVADVAHGPQHRRDAVRSRPAAQCVVAELRIAERQLGHRLRTLEENSLRLATVTVSVCRPGARPDKVRDLVGHRILSVQRVLTAREQTERLGDLGVGQPLASAPGPSAARRLTASPM